MQSKGIMHCKIIKKEVKDTYVEIEVVGTRTAPDLEFTRFCRTPARILEINIIPQFLSVRYSSGEDAWSGV